MLGQIISVDGFNIHYEKVGIGPEVLLLLPGGLGTSQTDFSFQLSESKGLNRQKFTIIAWDPPGHGYSRPPERDYHREIYKRDADLAANLMAKLGYFSYSVLGWSDGGKVALLMAIKYQSVINKAVVWAAIADIKPENKKALFATRNVQVWNPSVRLCFESVYGNELQQLWQKLVDHHQVNVDNVCGDEVKLIRCPTFILHGDCDPLLPGLEHPNFLAKQIPDSRLYRFHTGSHNIHQEFYKQFNQLVEEFLLE